MQFSLAEDFPSDQLLAPRTSTHPPPLVIDATNAAVVRPSKRPTAATPTTPSDPGLFPSSLYPAGGPDDVPTYPPAPPELRAAIWAGAQGLRVLLSRWADVVPFPDGGGVCALLGHIHDIQRAVGSPPPSPTHDPTHDTQTHTNHTHTHTHAHAHANANGPVNFTVNAPVNGPVNGPVNAAAVAYAAPHGAAAAAAHGAVPPPPPTPPSTAGAVPAPRSTRRPPPAAVTGGGGPKVSLLVEFKRGRVKKYDAEGVVSPGQYAIVDGDRGTDCGLVIVCCVRDEQGRVSELQSIDNCQVDMQRYRTEAGMVRRVATQEERELLHGDIATAERLALSTCRDLVSKMGLHMQVVDCEYQFDRKKISFYFESDESVDFRELNVELYRIYGVRIWLENLNSRVKNVVPDGALSHNDKLLFHQSGLRPPRRR